jgi:hypothetical protein
VIERHAHDPSFVELAGEYRLSAWSSLAKSIARLEPVL